MARLKILRSNRFTRVNKTRLALCSVLDCHGLHVLVVIPSTPTRRRGRLGYWFRLARWLRIGRSWVGISSNGMSLLRPSRDWIVVSPGAA
jgi:hypothetical protein